MRADAIKVAHSRAVVARRTASVFKPAYSTDPIIDADAGIDIRGVRFDELRPGNLAT